MMSIRKMILGLFFAVFAAAVSGCSSTPRFNCDNARQRIVEADEKVEKNASDYHLAEAQKDAQYYGVKTARTLTCVGTLGLLCGVADSIASDNVRTEKQAEKAKEDHAEAIKLSEGLRKAMANNDCDDIPPPIN